MACHVALNSISINYRLAHGIMVRVRVRVRVRVCAIDDDDDLWVIHFSSHTLPPQIWSKLGANSSKREFLR